MMNLKRGDLVKTHDGIHAIIERVRTIPQQEGADGITVRESHEIDIYRGDRRRQTVSPFGITPDFWIDPPPSPATGEIKHSSYPNQNFEVLMDAHRLRAEMDEQTLNDVCEALGYKPDHDTFSGDRLVALARRIADEHTQAVERLVESEEVTVLDGRICWRGSGNPLHQARSEDQ